MLLGKRRQWPCSMQDCYNLQFVKDTVSAKSKRVKHYTMRFGCTVWDTSSGTRHLENLGVLREKKLTFLQLSDPTLHVTNRPIREAPDITGARYTCVSRSVVSDSLQPCGP